MPDAGIALTPMLTPETADEKEHYKAFYKKASLLLPASPLS